MKHQPTLRLYIIVFSMIPMIGIAQDFPILPNKSHTISISLIGYSNELNEVDVGYRYNLIVKKHLTISTGLTGGIFYPRKKISTLTKADLLPFVAPNIEVAFGSKHIFYFAFWKNFMKEDQTPYTSALGYRHRFLNKNMSLKAFGSFLWIRNDSPLESPAIFTYGGIGIGLERKF